MSPPLRFLTLPFPVLWWPSPHFTPGRPTEVDLIVLHYISLPPGVFGTGDVIDLFLGRLDPRRYADYAHLCRMRVSAHFFIDRGGRIHQFVDTEDTAWHAGESAFEGRARCNEYSIGIELEGDEIHPFTASQYTSLICLCRALMLRYPGIRWGRVVGHSQIAPGRKKDPGPRFDWERLRRGLEKGGDTERG